ncbi:MAG TPA: DUF1326 domain-containing protein [Allosphingosinicella sp.]|nr:DUF1326 domain-containing protein [Allosphingosinicella sp.]
MAFVDWRMRGSEITNCNCDWGCPCQFNALPTRGDCRAVVAMRIDEGHFGEVPLSGLCWAGMFAWPKAIHEGGGEAFVVIDDKADEAQRSALLTVLSGQETEPGATIFNVFATVIDTHHEPAFRPIRFEADIENRTGRVAIDGIVDTRIEPIRNPVTGAPHRARVSMPDGFEYREAEYASGATEATGPVPLGWSSRHAHLTMLDMSTRGVA